MCIRTVGVQSASLLYSQYGDSRDGALIYLFHYSYLFYTIFLIEGGVRRWAAYLVSRDGINGEL